MLDALKDKFDKLNFNFKLLSFRDLNESQTRLSFIDNFWEYLGWEVRNTEQCRVELTDEESKRPDYRFLNNKGKTLFFVEAKKPAEDLKNPKHIYQTKLYCWNGNVPIAILTDYEEFRPFQSFGKPKLTEWNKGIIKQFDLKYEAYPDKAYDLLNTFGREAVMGGSLNSLTKPTQIELRDTVDKDFLNTLSKWRTDLATQIAKNNKFANEFDLSEAVQRILDRLVFLRILQDRDIENEDFIRSILNHKIPDSYSAFVEICKELAPKYNGLIFNPHPLSENLKIEKSLFKQIVKELDFEESPYRFDEIPVEMLGTIYERFLGDEINLDKKGKVVIDQKPEVRKAGGVYYTPQYIVEYIVQNTVGKLLEKCKTPEDASKLKILDPACGSGSFLLGAFDALIKWHEDYFSANPTKIIETKGKQNYKLAYLDDTNRTKLTARMKGRILQNNLFGVDLDKQATEVAQMSLYIKVLEGMANESQHAFGFQDAILPKLDNNIKCGNSLIGSDFIADDFFGLSEKEKHKINPFDWEEAFPFIKETGGFDAVIGNPPYILMQDEFRNNEILNYCKLYYESASYKIDTYHLFIERGIKVLNFEKKLSLIIPSNFLTNNYLVDLRKFILNNTEITGINTIYGNVFEEASVNTSIIILKKSNKENTTKIANFYSSNINNDFLELKSEIVFPQIKLFNSKELLFKFSNSEDLLLKIDKNNKPLSVYATVNFGMQLRDRKVFLDDVIEIKNQDDRIKLTSKHKECLTGKDILRYNLTYANRYCLEDTEAKRGGCWDLKIHHNNDKIIIRQIGESPICALDIVGRNCLNTVFMVVMNNEINSTYLLGILNSKLVKYYWINRYYDQRETFPKIKGTYLLKIPIAYTVNQKPLSELVERMLKLHKDRQSASEFDSKHIDQYIAKTDKEIDELVYKLYGLTEEEIRVVEGKS